MPAIEVTIEEGLFDYLSTETTYPIYPQSFPQRKTQVFPCVSYTKEQGGREYNLITKIGLEHPIFSLDVFGETYDSVVSVSNEIKGLLNGYRGSWREITIHNVIVRNITDFPPERKLGRDQYIFHQMITCEIWYARA